MDKETPLIENKRMSEAITQTDNKWQEEKEEFNKIFESHMNVCFDKATKDAIGDWWIKKFDSLLLNQKVSLKQRMIDCVPEVKQTTISYKGEQKPHKKFKTNVGFNDCREQTLSALNEIDV